MKSILNVPLRKSVRLLGLQASMDASDQELVKRLADLGLRPGVDLQVLFRIPFGGPLVVRLGAMSLALRLEEAECLMVE